MLYKIIRVIILIQVFITHNLVAQTYKELVMDSLSQRTNTWCWAASAEMVIKFFKPMLSDSAMQPAIVKHYSKFRGWGVEKKDCKDCLGDSLHLLVKKTNSSCDISMQTSSKQYMKQVLLDCNFISNEVNNTPTPSISWAGITQHIDNCRPFIVVVDPTNGQGIGSNHAIVAKGYYFTNSLNYIIANDPWSTCDKGRETIFPYSNFLQIQNASLKGINIDRVVSIVENIKPNDNCNNNNECFSCAQISQAMNEALGIDNCVITNMDAAFLNSTIDFRTGLGGNSFSFPDTGKVNYTGNHLISFLVKNAENVVGFNQNIIVPKKLDSLLRIKHNYSAPVKYLSIEKLKRCFLFFQTANNIGDNLNHTEEVRDIVSGTVAPDIVSTFQKGKSGNWHLVGITDYTLLKENIPISIPNGTPVSTNYLLSNLQGADKEPNSIPYELIKIPPFRYEFFSYSINGVKMMTPCSDFKELDLKTDSAYPEEIVIKKLREISRGFAQQFNFGFFYGIKRFFGFSK